MYASTSLLDKAVQIKNFISMIYIMVEPIDLNQFSLIVLKGVGK